METNKKPILLTSSHRHLYEAPREEFPLQQPRDLNISSEGKPWDLKAVGFIQSVMHQATDPTMVLPMVLASPVYHLGKVATLRGLLAQQGATWLSRGLSLKVLPVAAAFAMETSAFSLGSRSLSHFIDGPVPWDLSSVATDLAMAGLTLGFLKSAGFAGRKATEWARGLDEFQPQIWSKADHRALFWTSQASGYLGLVGAHSLQANIFPEMHPVGGNIWMDSLGTHLALGLGSYAGRSLLGSGFHHLERQLAQQAHSLDQRARIPMNDFDSPHGGWTSAPVSGAAILQSGLGSFGWSGRSLPENVLAMSQHDEGKGAGPRSSMHPTSRPPPYAQLRLEEATRLLNELYFFQDGRLAKEPSETQSAFIGVMEGVRAEDVPILLNLLKSGLDRGDSNSCARVLWGLGQITPFLEGKGQWEVAQDIVLFLGEGLAKEHSSDEVSTTLRRLAGNSLERIAAKSKQNGVEGWDEIEKFSRSLDEILKAFGNHPGLEPAIHVKRAILHRLPVPFQLEAAQTILGWHFQNARSGEMRLDFDYFKNSLRLWGRTDMVRWLENRIDEISGEVHYEASLKVLWLGMVKELHAKHHRLFEWNAVGDGRVDIHPNAGGFENITQGGLAGYIGLRYLQRQASEQVDLAQPSVISVRLAEALAPGGTYLLESQVSGNGHKVGIRAAGDTRDRVQVQWERNEEPRPNIPEGLQPLLQGKLTPDSSFNCIPNCVVSGLDNPLGLRLTNHILRGPDGKITYLYQELNPRGAGIMEQLMAMDELGWWAGAAVSEQKGVTVKFQIRTWERGDAPEKVFIIAQAPGNARKITDVQVWVIENSGNVLAQGSVGFMPHAEAAQKGSGEGADNFRQDLLGRLNRAASTAAQAQLPATPALVQIVHDTDIMGLAQRALFLNDTHRDPSQAPRFTTDFQGMVRPGDTLRFFVEDFERFDPEKPDRPKVLEAGTRVTVLNQRDELVLKLTDQTPGEQARRVQEGDQVKYLYRKIEYQKDGTQKVTFREVPIDAQAGIQRVREIAQAMEAKHRLGELSEAPDQPSVTLGVSSGNGLHSAIAEIAFAKLRRGVGVFFEPLSLVASRNPVQISALENVEGLRVLAAEQGADYPILYTNAILPQRDGTVRKLSPKYHEEVQRQRAGSAIPDLNLTNSVAFSLHIGPLPGVAASPHVPTLNFMKEGLLEMVRLKEANEEAGHAGTLIPMGENIGAIWREHQAYYGPRSLSLMATWAGGSQNIEVLPGIYGGGYLGMGKQIGETATLDAHMASRAAGYAQGHFKVVRLPAFNSRALWMIPGGPLMGLISKRVLDNASPPNNPLYKDLTDLAPEVHYKIRSGIHQREHPLAQIELDSAENTFMPEIKRGLDMIYQRVADELPGYRETYEIAKGQVWDGKTFDLSLLEQIPNLAERFKERHGREYKPFTYPDGSMRLFDMDATKRILQGLVPENWQELMPAPDSVAEKRK